MAPPPRTKHGRAPLIEELERRILLSADQPLFDGSDPTAPPPAQADLLEPISEATSATAEASRELIELVFVDTGVEGHEQLVDLLRAEGSDFEVYLIDASESGFDQIGDILEDYQGVDAIHVISHGTAGAVQLGSDWLSANTLSNHEADLAAWKESLSEEADLLFYGCDLASNESGEDLVGSIAKLTGADVAASDDLTGAASLGGDWELETTAGRVETGAIASSVVGEWVGTLVTETFQQGVDGYTGTEDTVLDSGSPDSSTPGGWSSVTVDTDDGSGAAQGLLQFNDLFGSGPGQIPLGSTITSASLTIDVSDATVDPKVIGLHRMNVDWSEASTWNSLTGGIQLDDVEAMTTADATVPDTRVTGAVTIAGLEGALQAWSNGDANHGWAIITDSNDGWDFSSSDNGTASLRPQLTVQYTAPVPGAPTDLQATATSQGGLSLNADGGDDVVLVADDGGAILGGLSTVTIESTFSITTPGGDLSPLLSYAEGANDEELALLLKSTGHIWFGVHSNGTPLQSTTGTYLQLFDGEKHHVGVSWDSTNGAVDFYVDGALVESFTGYQTGLTTAAGGQLVFGQDQDSELGGYSTLDVFHGTLYDVRIFDDIRSSAEILANFDQTLSYDEANLRANWKFDLLSTDGVILENVSGNNLTVQHVSAAGFTASEATLKLSVADGASNGTVVGVVTGSDTQRDQLRTKLLTDDPSLVYSAETGKFYKAISGSSTWAAAFANAQSQSLQGSAGQLVTIRSAAENELVHGLAQSIGQSVWIGGTDQSAEGSWRWMEGATPADSFWTGGNSGSSVDNAYQNWEAGQPDDSAAAPGDDWVGLRATSGEWVDQHGSATGAWVVEWDADDVLDASAPLTYAITSQTVAGAFAIDADNGEITVADGSLLDRQVNPAHSVTVRVTDGGGASYDEAFTVTLRSSPVAATLWLTTEQDVASPSGASGLGTEGWTGGEVLSFDDPNLTLGATTTGTFNRVFDLDDFVQDGDARVDSIHWVDTALTVGSNSIPLQVGDILLSTVNVETLVNSDTSTVSITSNEVFIFRPDDATDYSLGGSFIPLINGWDLGSVEIEGITLVEQTTTVGDGAGAITLNPGDFLLTDRSNDGKIYRFQPGVLGDGATNTGTLTVLVDGTDLGIAQKIHGVEVIETDTVVGNRTLTSGQLLISLYADDVVSGTSVSRSDIFVLNVTTAGANTVATVETLFEGGDVGLDTWQESPWAVSLVPTDNQAPTATSGTVVTNEDTTHVFSASDFRFSDDDVGDSLQQVQITALEATGSLELSGSAVAVGQVVTRGQIDAGALTFDPAPDANGTAHDSFEYRVHDGVAYSASTAVVSLIDANFDADAEGFVYADDVFGTSAPGSASGQYSPIWGVGGSGGLYVMLEPRAAANTDPASAGWSRTFALANETTVSVTATYRMWAGNGLDVGEYAEAVLEVDGVRHGNDTNSSLVHAEGNGDGGANFDSGWRTDTFDLVLSSGVHTLALGGFSNQANAIDEWVEFVFDDVSVMHDSNYVMSIDVDAVNDAPVRTAGGVADLVVPEDSGLTSLGLGGLAYGPGGGADEASQTLTYEVTVIPDPVAFGKIYLADGTTQVSTGAYSLTDIQGMQFEPAANETGGPSFFSFRVTDSGGTPNGGVNILTEAIQLDITPANDPPSVTTTGTTLAYTENDGGVAVDPGLTVSDVDTADLNGATVQIAAGFASSEDSLGFTDQLGVVGSYNAGTGVLTLTGLASAADYQTALRSVTYANSSEVPDTTDRVISFQVNDGLAVAGASRTVSVASINDDPSNLGSLPTDITVTEDTFSAVDLSALDLSDVDAGNQLITLRLTTSTGGNLYSSTDFDVTVSGSGTGTLWLQGSVSGLNSYMNAPSLILYDHATTHTAGNDVDTIQVDVWDNGNTGDGGGGVIALGTVNVDITAVNDAPVRTAGTVADLVVAEDSGLTSLGLGGLAYGPGGGADEASQTLTYELTVIPDPVAFGKIYLADGTTQVGTGTYSLADIQGMQFEPAENENGGPSFFSFRVIDSGGTPNGGADRVTETIRLDITPQNDAPIITSDGGGATANVDVAENTTAVTTITSTDAELDPATYSISGGDDAARFQIDGGTGVLSFKNPKDFENPADVGTDNVYEVVVRAEDAFGGADTQTLYVRVTDVADGIRITPLSTAPIGEELQVNTTTTDVQMILPNSSRGVATDAAGNFAVVWSSNLQDGSGYGVYLQRFAADGSALGVEEPVNTTTADNQLNASIAMHSDGSFVVTWSSTGQDGDSNGVYARRYDAVGSPLTGEVRVNTMTTNAQGTPTISMAGDGSYVIAWGSYGQDGDASGIYAQRFGADGSTQGVEFQVSTYTAGNQQLPSIASAADGGFVVTWVSDGQDGDNFGVYAQRFEADGSAAGSEFLVTNITANSQSYPSVAMAPEGGFVIAWQNRNADSTQDVYVQRYAEDGTALGSATQVNATSQLVQPIVSVDVDESGNFTVVWNTRSGGDQSDILGRQFDRDGNPLGGEFLVNSTTSGDQLYASVAAAPNGQLVVAWSGSGPGDADGVFAQRFGLVTDEGGGTATFQVSLESEPKADVIIPVSVSDGSEGSVSVGTLTFTSGDWNVPQTVTVTGLQDVVVDGDQPYTVILGAASSADPNFNGLDPSDLLITNIELPNTAPVATNDVAVVLEGGSVVIDLTGNDTDVDNPLDLGSITITSAPAYGSLADNGNGTLTYTHNGSETLGDGFSYTIDDVTGAASNVANVTLTVTPQNDPPTISGFVTSLAENSGLGTVVGSVTHGDPDVGDTRSFAITAGNTGTAFAIDAAGQITVASPGALDFETTPSFTLTVETTDAGGLTASDTVTVNLLNVNENPTIAGFTTSLAENSGLGTVVGSVTHGDPDVGDTRSFAITAGNTGTAFAIDGNGQITVATPGALDLETTPSFTLTIETTDAGGLTASDTVTVNLTNVNETPTIAGFTTSLAENSGLGTVVGSMTHGDPDVGDTRTFAITAGNTGTAFAIDASGQITVATPGALDLETTPSFTLTIETTDAGGLTASDTVTVNLLNVNENPTLTGFTTSLAENSGLGTVVGSVTHGDPDVGDTRTFAITAGNTGTAFAIDASGQITVATPGALDLETTPSFTLTIETTDAGGLTASDTVTVNLSNVNESPTLTGFTASLAENSGLGTVVGSVTHGDPDVGDTRSFAITGGNIGTAFAIDATGQITVANPGALDLETTPSFTLTVETTDAGGLTASDTVTVNLSNVNENPTIAGFTTSLAENSGLGTVVGSVTHGDPDVGDTRTFAITAGNTGTAFAIDASGQITVANPGALDLETTPSFTLTIETTDAGGLTASDTVTVNLSNVNENPTIAGFTTSLAENSGLGTVIGSVTHGDPDVGDTRTFAITAGNTGTAFAIDGNGQITVATPGALDLETTPSFTLTIETTDAGGLTASDTVTVNLTNVNENPTLTGFTTSLAENSGVGTVVGSVAHGDPDVGDTRTFAITGGNTGTAFAIDGNGQITVATPGALDLETTPSFTLTIETTDAGGLTASDTVTVNLTNVNETPTIAGFTTSLAENSGPGTVVGSVTHGDPDVGDTRSFAITAGNTGTAFAIDASGQITVANPGALDLETTPSFTLTVETTDAGGLTASDTVTVNLSNANEAPTVTGFTTSLAENSGLGTVVGSVTHGDPDVGDTRTFAITGGNTGTAFAIDGNGQITVATPGALDLETTPSFTLTIETTDAGGLTASDTVTVNLTNVNENPTLTGFTTSLPENSTLGTVVGSVTHGDPDVGDTRSFAITAGNTGTAFAIDAAGQITVATPGALDFETTPSFTLTIETTDAGSLTASDTVTVNLSNVNENPTIAGFTTSLAENSGLGTVVGSVTHGDPDVGDTRSFAITAGNTGTAFAIDGNGQITVATPGALDLETTPSFTLTIETTDAGGLTASDTVTVNLTNVNETPTIAGFTTSLAENSGLGTVVGSVTHGDPDVGDTRSFAITAGNTGTAFAIDGNGQITVATPGALDLETTPSFTLTIETTDAGGLAASDTVTVNLTNVNETPTLTGFTTSLAENSGLGTVVGSVTHADPDVGDTRTFAITAGNAGTAFAIDASGQITVATPGALDLETTPSFTLTIETTDAGGLTASDTVTVNLTNVNETPTLTGFTTSLAENSGLGTVVGSVTHGDPDVGDTRTFAITAGNTGTAFAIDASGQITVANPGALDLETTPSFTLTIETTDAGGLTGSDTVTVNLTNVNESPTLTGFTTSLAENSGLGTVIGSVTHGDPDVGDTRTFAITAGNTGTAFAIDGNGQITVATPGALDLETTPSFTLTIETTDAGGLTAADTVTVNLTNANEAPTLTGFTTTLPENSGLGTVVGSVTHGDPDAGDTRTFAITAGNTGTAFAIDASGQITVATPGALDLETTPSFTLTIETTDAGGLTASDTVTVNLSNVNESPTVTGFTTSLAENSGLGTVVGSVTHGDPDVGDTRSFAITAGNTGTAFAIDGNGQITVATPGALDLETTPSFTLTIETTDAGGLTASDTVTVNLSNVNENPTLTGFAASLAENSGLGTVVGSVTHGDPDVGDTRSFAITAGNTGAAFAIDGSGQVTVNDPTALDFETSPAFSLSVQATDAGGLSATDTVSVTLSNQNEAPTVAGSAMSVSSSAAAGTMVGAVVAADEDAGDSVSYLIVSGNGGGAFSIDGVGGIRVASPSAVAAMAGGSASLTVEAADAGGLVATTNVSIAISDGTDAPDLSGGTPPTPDPGPEITDLDDPKGEDPGDPAPPAVPGPAGSGGDLSPEADPVPTTTLRPAPAPLVLDPDDVGSQPRPFEFGAFPGLDTETVSPSVGSQPAESVDSEERSFARRIATGLTARDVATSREQIREAIDRVRSEMESDARRIEAEQSMFVSTTEGAALVASSALLAALLRTGSLAAMAVSSLPLWGRVDPLAVLTISEEQRRQREAELRAARLDDGEAGRILDAKREGDAQSKRSKERGTD